MKNTFYYQTSNQLKGIYIINIFYKIVCIKIMNTFTYIFLNYKQLTNKSSINKYRYLQFLQKQINR